MPRRISIIGGGYAGAAAAIHLAQSARSPLDITVVEPREKVGGGTAYSTDDPALRLNVEDSLMVLYTDALDHFSLWLTDNGEREADPEGVSPEGEFFARRSVFGRYVAGEFARAVRKNPSGSVVRHCRDTVEQLDRDQDRWAVKTTTGKRLAADLVVLAVGNECPAPIAALPDEVRAHPTHIGDPWSPGALDGVGADSRVLLVGSGLTAVDVVASLTRLGHRGQIDMISRRGLLPQVQGEFPGIAEILRRNSQPVPALIQRHGKPEGISEVLRWVRADARADAEQGLSWREAFDAVRDAAKHIWPALDLAERQRFFRHLKPYYDSHRFRIAPQVHRIVEARLADGSMTVKAARLTGASLSSAGLQISLRDRGQDRIRQATCDRVINCTGPNPDPAQSGIGFLRAALADGILTPDPAGVGLNVNARCEVIDRFGRPDSSLIALGPMTRGHFGEVVAVPQITLQLAPLIQLLAAEGRL